ncbi:MAG: aldehyde ferredoxin oxidoreductase [Deltaproteobacteria bacterium RBG_13_49_15]|nr:MAG: aldehyde ferredoxin oxidoreductase [Deltaproteobacteria bacterium RBG_13_49_15]
MPGWIGRMLNVDLSRGRVMEEALDTVAARNYIGGRGLGIYYLNRMASPLCHPLSEENVLIMATGPLTGTGAPTGARYMVVTKSPLSGGLTCSNSGGQFPAELKFAGFDGIIFTGKAAEPVYLSVKNGKAELRQAAHLWGKDTHESTDKLLQETQPDARVACIGQAGENRVLFASVMNDRDRAAGRSGVGAVMGSKNLKAVVVKGEGRIPLADDAAFKSINRETLKRFNEASRVSPPALRNYGTAYGVEVMNHFGILPTKNFQMGTFHYWERINGKTLREKFFVRNRACYACPIGCGRNTRVEVPGFEGSGEGPEYETIYALGANCMVDNYPAVIKANYICNEMGMDTITMGTTIACAMELFERGYLTEKDAGRPLIWGDGQALVDLCRMTALREGFGNILAEGSFRLAERFGHPELAMVAKKQEFAGYDPRGAQGMGLAYATSPIGGSHMRGDPAYSEVFGVLQKADPFTAKGKAGLVKDHQDLSCIIDSAGLCIFFAARFMVRDEKNLPPEGILKYLNAATGANYTLNELNTAGERIFNAERLFLTRAGFSAKDDTLPPRITFEPLPDGPAKGHVCHLEEMLKDYYPVRGWTAGGIPTEQTLARLGLREG